MQCGMPGIGSRGTTEEGSELTPGIWLIPSVIYLRPASARLASWLRRSNRGARSTTWCCRHHAAGAQSRAGPGPEARPHFQQWGLAERHSTRAGSRLPLRGTARHREDDLRRGDRHALGKKLLVVRYAELESRWVGQTAKHVAAVFRDAARARTRCSSSTRRMRSPAGGSPRSSAAYEREANAVVNVLLHELETVPRRGHLRHQPRRQHRSRLRAADPHAHSLRDARRRRSGSGSGRCSSTPQDAARG